MITRKAIEAFLVQYGAALTRRELDTVLASWRAPSFFINDNAAAAMPDQTAMESYLEQAGLTAATSAAPVLEGYDVLGSALISADVVWRGAAAPQARFRYLMSGNDETGFRLRAAIPVSKP